MCLYYADYVPAEKDTACDGSTSTFLVQYFLQTFRCNAHLFETYLLQAGMYENYSSIEVEVLPQWIRKTRK